MEYTEDAPHEAGFARVFAEEVWPVYAASREEAERMARRASRLGRSLAGLGAAIAVGFFLFDPLGDTVMSRFIGLFAGVFIAMIGRALWEAKRRRFNAAVKAEVAPVLARFAGVARYETDPSAGFVNLSGLSAARMVGRSSGSSVQDGFAGEWRGVDYRMAELRLTRVESYHQGGKRRTRTVVVFAGLLLEMAVPRRVPVIRIEPRAKWKTHRRLRPDGLHPVDMGTGPGAGEYQVWSTEPQEAGEVISGLFLDALLEVAMVRGLEPKALSARFEGEQFQLLIEDRRKFLEVEAFEVGPEEFRASVRAALADLALARVIVDRLVEGPTGAQ